MANDLKGEFDVVIDDRTLTLKFTHNAIRFLESRHQSVLKQLAQLGVDNEAISISFIMDGLFAGLQHLGDKRITQRYLENKVPLEKVTEYIKPVLLALVLAFKGPKAVQDIIKASEDADAELNGVPAQADEPEQTNIDGSPMDPTEPSSNGEITSS